jgi:Amidohydrolase family
MSIARFASASFASYLLIVGCSGGGGTETSSSMTSSSSTTSSSSSMSSSSGSPADAGPDGSAPSTTCSVAHQGTSGVVLQGTVLTAAMPLAGEVFIDSAGKIACVAASCSTTAGYAAATVLSCPGSVISPGLINSHDHTEYDTTPPIPHGTTRWDHRNGWRTGAGGEPLLPNAPQSTTNASVMAAAELRFVMGGATSVIGSGGVHGLLRNLAAYPDTTMVEGLTGPTVFFDTFPLGDSNGTELTSGCAYPDPRSASTAFEGGAAYAPHVAEGINLAAENEFTCVSGSLGLLTAQTAVIHAVGLNAKDVNAIATAKAKVIWAPRSNVSLYGNTAPVTVFKALDVTVALGTDWAASGSINMLRELQCADSLNQGWFGAAFTDQELWMMATKNGAVAAKFDSQIGELATGLVGDVAIFTGTTLDYRAVIDAGVEDVRLVLRGGKALYGDADLVAALATTCTALEVCGLSKQVCIDTPGVTLAEVQAAAAPIYPLFFCKGTTPTNEPSCVPYRSTYPNGETASDPDGDGLTGTTDDCPGVFNPIRPMDGTTQADVDGDGVGDACDPKPLDATVK